jgi:polar amino acid transport system substrate-binding protein
MAWLALALVMGLGTTPDTPEDRTLVVGTHSLPPFVVRASDGRWTGESIELWREIAEEEGLRFELQERDLAGLFTGLEDGSLDVAAGAMTVTAEREATRRLHPPDFTTGLAIALAHVNARRAGSTSCHGVQRGLPAPARHLRRACSSLVGAVMWLLERRQNPHFQGSPAAGLGAGLWWAVVTMATVGYGDTVPRTGAGRLLAMVWMLASLIILTTATASITTSLTLGPPRGAGLRPGGPRQAARRHGHGDHQRDVSCTTRGSTTAASPTRTPAWRRSPR